MSRTEADDFFDLQVKFGVAESDMKEKLYGILGLTDEKYDNIHFTFDWYDYSFEIHALDELEWVPTNEQMSKCWEIGFLQFWINYTDHTERHAYSKDNSLSKRGNKYIVCIDEKK